MGPLYPGETSEECMQLLRRGDCSAAVVEIRAMLRQCGLPLKGEDPTFDSDVLKSGKTVVVDFWAEWCGPCKMVAPVLDEIAGENREKITVAKLDIDVNQKTAQAYQVMSIPTMIVFQDGKPVKQIVGARPKAALLSDLADYLG